MTDSNPPQHDGFRVYLNWFRSLEPHLDAITFETVTDDELRDDWNLWDRNYQILLVREIEKYWEAKRNLASEATNLNAAVAAAVNATTKTLDERHVTLANALRTRQATLATISESIRVLINIRTPPERHPDWDPPHEFALNEYLEDYSAKYEKAVEDNTGLLRFEDVFAKAPKTMGPTAQRFRNHAAKIRSALADAEPASPSVPARSSSPANANVGHNTDGEEDNHNEPDEELQDIPDDNNPDKLRPGITNEDDVDQNEALRDLEDSPNDRSAKRPRPQHANGADGNEDEPTEDHGSPSKRRKTLGRDDRSAQPGASQPPSSAGLPRSSRANAGAAADAQPANAQPANAQPANAQPANAQPANAQPANAQPANVNPPSIEPAGTEQAGADAGQANADATADTQAGQDAANDGQDLRWPRPDVGIPGLYTEWLFTNEEEFRPLFREWCRPQLINGAYQSMQDPGLEQLASAFYLFHDTTLPDHDWDHQHPVHSLPLTRANFYGATGLSGTNNAIYQTFAG